MATYTITQTTDNASSTTFRAWGSAFGPALAAVGLVQTADTGQVNWSTVVVPAAINTYPGFEIFRFNDALQATAPVYLKVEYGCSGSTATPAMRFQTGTGTNGAGTLTGTLSTQVVLGTFPTFGSRWFFSGSTSRLSFVVFTDANRTCLGNIERTRNASGIETGTGLHLLWRPIGVAGQQQVLTFGGTVETLNTGGWGFYGSTASRQCSFTHLQFLPIYATYAAAAFGPPLMGFMGAIESNVTPKETVFNNAPAYFFYRVSRYGVLRTYLHLPQSVLTSSVGRLATGGQETALLLWE